jgi:hypothetical protein
VNNRCGFSVLSGDNASMQKAIDVLVSNEDDFNLMRENAWSLLQREFKVDYSYEIIKNKLENV